MSGTDGRRQWVLMLLGESIAGRLLRWFVTISAVPVLLVLLVTWFIARESVQSMRLGSLSAIAEQKADRLHAYAHERAQCVTALGVSPGVNAAISHLSDPAAKAGSHHRDREFLAALATSYASPSVVLVSADGVILHATGDPAAAGRRLDEIKGEHASLARVIDRVRTLMQTEISESESPRAGERPGIFAAAPVIENRELRGFIAMQLAPDAIDSVVLDETGLGETGETICAAVVRGELVVTAPTRFDPSAAFNVRVPMGSTRLVSLQAAAMGHDAIGMGDDAAGEPVIGAWTHVAPLRWGLCVVMSRDEAFALARHQQLAALGIAFLATLTAALVAWFVARSLSRPIERAAAASERLASGNLAMSITPIGRGEPRRLLDAMSLATTSLGSLLGRVRRSASELEQTAAEIRRTAADQEEVAQGFGASTTEIAAAVTEMTGTGRELATNMSVVAEAAQNAAASAGRGREGIAELDERAKTLAEATGGIERRLETIRERAAAINTVVTTITRVADQTNLLSINAALEAEKAGRYGLGFQVVAREINRLSEQTAEATTDIERIVAEMQEAVAEGVGEMGRFTRVMDEGASTAEQIGGRLSEIIDLVEDLKERFARVAEGMDAQSTGTRQIAEAMNQLSDGARRTIAAVRSFVAASEQLERSAKALDGDVGRFTLPTP